MWPLSWIMGRILDLCERIGEAMAQWRLALPLAVVAFLIPLLSPSFDLASFFQVVWGAVPTLATMGPIVRKGGFHMPTEAEVFRFQRMSLPFLGGFLGILVAGSGAGSGLPPISGSGADLLPPM